MAFTLFAGQECLKTIAGSAELWRKAMIIIFAWNYFNLLVGYHRCNYFPKIYDFMVLSWNGGKNLKYHFRNYCWLWASKDHICKERKMESHMCPTSSLRMHKISGRHRLLSSCSCNFILLWLSVVVIQYTSAAGKLKKLVDSPCSANFYFGVYISWVLR